MDLLRKVINTIADLLPVGLALIFVAVVILSVCHATTALQQRTDSDTCVNQSQQVQAPRSQAGGEDDIKEALRSGEWQALVPDIVP